MYFGDPGGEQNLLRTSRRNALGSMYRHAVLGADFDGSRVSWRRMHQLQFSLRSRMKPQTAENAYNAI